MYLKGEQNLYCYYCFGRREGDFLKGEMLGFWDSKRASREGEIFVFIPYWFVNKIIYSYKSRTT
jgi:hypothetical protein